MSKEKKKTIIITVILSVVCLALIGFLVVKALKENGIITSEETNEVMKEFNKQFNSKERKVIFFASSSCGYCELQKPILETIAEDYDMEYLEIDAATLGAKQRNEIIEKLEIEGKTPTTVIVQNGKVIDVAEGYIEGRNYVEFFASNELLPEDAVYSKEKNLTFIDYEEYEDIIDKKGTYIVVIGQTTCSHCIAIKPALNKVAGEYDLTINYLNLTEMSEDEYNDFQESLIEIEYNDPDFVEKGEFGTPLTLIIENGKVKDYISGQRTNSQLVREFKKVGLISE
ncbi:MAG: thioredoxin family protein [Bacilli bacterium]|nr:thioredoxin family protein [Bacilli bacterium]